MPRVPRTSAPRNHTAAHTPAPATVHAASAPHTRPSCAAPLPECAAHRPTRPQPHQPYSNGPNPHHLPTAPISAPRPTLAERLRALQGAPPAAAWPRSPTAGPAARPQPPEPAPAPRPPAPGAHRRTDPLSRTRLRCVPAGAGGCKRARRRALRAGASHACLALPCAAPRPAPPPCPGDPDPSQTAAHHNTPSIARSAPCPALRPTCSCRTCAGTWPSSTAHRESSSAPYSAATCRPGATAAQRQRAVPRPLPTLVAWCSAPGLPPACHGMARNSAEGRAGSHRVAASGRRSARRTRAKRKQPLTITAHGACQTHTHTRTHARTHARTRRWKACSS
jgi:hypothetical protein